VYCRGAKHSSAAYNQEAADKKITGKYFEPRLIITLPYDLRFVIKLFLTQTLDQIISLQYALIIINNTTELIQNLEMSANLHTKIA
jgi:hypothetical protein